MNGINFIQPILELVFYLSQNFFKSTKTINAIPIMDAPKRISARFSQRCVQIKLLLFIDAKERITEMHSKTETMLATSSIMELEVAELRCKDVITIKQNPSKLAAVGRICCEVLFDIALVFRNKEQFYLQAFWYYHQNDDHPECEQADNLSA